MELLNFLFDTCIFEKLDVIYISVCPTVSSHRVFHHSSHSANYRSFPAVALVLSLTSQKCHQNVFLGMYTHHIYNIVRCQARLTQ